MRSIVRFACLLWLALVFSSAAAETATGVGMHAIEVHDPVGGANMPGYVFYPSAKKGSTAIEGYDVAAVTNVAPLAGVRPLIVLSHGNGGSAFDLHDLATYLAAHGFVVATLEHPRDNYHDQSGVGRAPVLDGRPVQVQAVISYLLDDKTWSRRIDATRIGVGGFSAGGYTSLLLVGAVPDFSRFISYCARYPGDDLCAGADKFRAEAASHGQTVEQVMQSIQQDFGRWGKAADPRVKAAFAMAPLSLIFDDAGVASIDRPVFLYYGQDDRVARPKENALHIAPSIHHLDTIKQIPAASHWVFLAPCSAAMAKRLPVMCTDAPGLDRVKVHAQIQADALAFFRKTLAVTVAWH